MREGCLICGAKLLYETEDRIAECVFCGTCERTKTRCERDAYLSLQEATAFVREHFGVVMAESQIICQHSHRNSQCIGSRCPFHTVHSAGQQSG